jgi:hypothetical protein
MFCNDGPCEEEGCGATPVLRRCHRCAIAGLVTVCAHSELSAPIDVSTAGDWPSMTCDYCERIQEDICSQVESLLGSDAHESDLTVFRKAVNAGRSRPSPTSPTLDQSPVRVAVCYVWNHGNWRQRVAELLAPPS